MAHQVADVFDADAAGGQDGHERVPELPRCPRLPEPGGVGDDGELAADLPPVQRAAVLPAEDQVVVCGAVGPASAPGSAFPEARPAHARRLSAGHADVARSPAHRPVLHVAVFLAPKLSSSRPPPQARPCGRRTRWLRQPRPDVHSQGFGAYEEPTRPAIPAGYGETLPQAGQG